MKKIVTLTILSLFFSKQIISAHAEFLPQGKASDPTNSVILFEDPYTGFLLRSDNRTLGTVAISLPLYSFEHDLIYAYTGVEATLRNQGASFNSETLDLRVGAKWVHPFSEHIYGSLGLGHTSGHVVDDVIEKGLVPFNVGIDGFPLRLVYSTLEHFRFGLHGVVPIGSDPPTRLFTLGWLTEFYFTDLNSISGWMIGNDIYLPENPNIVLSTVTELVYRYRQARLMVGFHTGADVRLKHQLFLKSQVNFGFAGFRFEI